MNLGLVLPNIGPYADARLLADLAHEAEAAGWDGVFLTDTIQMEGYESSPVVSPWPALAAMAMTTSRIRLGLRVAAPIRRRPHQLALEAVTIDRMSNGRLVLGIGLGDEHDRGFAAFGEEMDPKVRARMLDESLEIITGLWRGEPLSFRGEHYRVHGITQLPTPVQQPRIPIWVGWLYPRRKPLDRAARWDGISPFTVTPDGEYRDLEPDEIRGIVADIRARRTDDTPFEVVIDAPVLGNAASSERLRANRDAGATWAIEYIAPERDPAATRAALRQGPPALD